MLHKGSYRGGKHNPMTQDAHRVHKSSAGPRSGRRPQPFNMARSAPYCKQEETKGTQYGIRSQPFGATEFAGEFEQAEEKGNTGLGNAMMLRYDYRYVMHFAMDADHVTAQSP